ncbi:MAG: TonB-dependent receptor [Alistipes sp.]|nr:TonB-dependent receptor [Alistipes sp.]
MRYISFALLLLLTLCIEPPQRAVAQEHKRVEVTTIYTPEVAKASKMLPPASIADSSDMDPDIHYNIHPDTWQIELEDHNFKPATAGYWDFSRARRFHTRIAGGAPMASDFAFNFLSQNIRVGYIGVSLDHKGNFSKNSNSEGVVRSRAHSYDTQNYLSVIGGLVSGRQTFEASLDYNFSVYNRYAELTFPNRLYFHDTEAKLRYGDSFTDLSRLNFAVELHGGFWAHSPAPLTDEYEAAPQFDAGALVRLARDFKGNVVGLSAQYDMWQATKSPYRDIRFGVGVEYAREFHFMSLEASLGYLYDRVRECSSASHFIMPKLRLMFDVGYDALRPYVDVCTTVSQNSVAELYNENPYIDYNAAYDALMSMPNTRSYNLVVGLSGIVGTSKFAYNVSLGANLMRDQRLWYINKVGTFGVAAANNNRLFISADLEYRPVGGLVLSAKFTAHADNSEGEYIVDDPRMEGAINVKYGIKRWNFYLGGELMGKRRWSAEDAAGIVYESFTSPVTFDLRAGIAFKASSTIEIYVDGYNLLNDQRIYDYAYYYRNGIGCMAGVKIDF